MSKRTSAAEAVAHLQDGMTIGIGGWGSRRKPMALVREICRSPVDDLTVVSYGGPDVGLLCAAGKVRKLVYSFVSLDVVPLDPHFRAARESGSIEVMEVDEGMLQWGLYAASLRLPFLPTAVGIGTDVELVNPDLRRIRSPYADGQSLIAMPPLELDMAFVHVNRADESGNGQILGPDPYFDDLFCAAAERRVVSCERITSSEEMLTEGCIHTLSLNRTMVDHVVEVPYGAHFTSCAPDYGIDEEHLDVYIAASERSVLDDYWDRYVNVTDVAYRDAVGGEARLHAIPVKPF
jgi:glutaconate CoA-transferase, subunit A